MILLWNAGDNLYFAARSCGGAVSGLSCMLSVDVHCSPIAPGLPPFYSAILATNILQSYDGSEADRRVPITVIKALAQPLSGNSCVPESGGRRFNSVVLARAGTTNSSRSEKRWEMEKPSAESFGRNAPYQPTTRFYYTQGGAEHVVSPSARPIPPT